MAGPPEGGAKPLTSESDGGASYRRTPPATSTGADPRTRTTGATPPGGARRVAAPGMARSARGRRLAGLAAQTVRR